MYAVNLDLRNVRIVVVGGGKVAARKVAGLLSAHAIVRVIAPSFDAALSRLNALRRSAGKLHLIRRAYRSSDLRGARMAIAATSDMELNQRIAREARAKGLLVNVVAPPDAGNMHIPATLQRGKVCIAVSTEGISAGLARALRQRLEKQIGHEWGQVAALLEKRRPQILKSISDPQKRRGLLKLLGSERWVRMAKSRGVAGTANEMDKLIEKVSVKPKRGAL